MQVGCRLFLVVTWWMSLLNCEVFPADTGSIPVDRSSYELIFQEFSRFEAVSKRERKIDLIVSDVLSESLHDEEVVNALVELGIKSLPEEVPWEKLLILAEHPRTSGEKRLWATITAGKALCAVPRPQKLERWLFQQLNSGALINPAIVVLGVSRIASDATLREWSRLLRAPDTSDETCRSICIYAVTWGAVYKGGTLDEGVNCLLAGYDETAISPQRRILIWEYLSLIPDADLHRMQVEYITMWALHGLALREFANENHPALLRATAVSVIRPGEAITEEAFSAAKKILLEDRDENRLRTAARHILDNAEKYGIQK